MIRRTHPVYLLLAAVWAMVLAWQAIEHHWVRESARAALINRSRDIKTTLEVVIRSQRRFVGMIPLERLEPALRELVKSGELSSVALLNASGDIVASAGSRVDWKSKAMMQTGERWDPKTVTLVYSVDLGTNQPGETSHPTIVLPKRNLTNSPPRPEDLPRPWPPPGPPPAGPPPGFLSFTNGFGNPSDRPPARTNRPELAVMGNPRSNNWRGFPRPFRNEEEYKSLLQTRGLHGLVIAMSTEAFRRANVEDLWMRWIISSFATIAVIGLGLAWRNLAKSAELQIRLLRASELNSHLKEMNVAAAGLAHETRNPLNIIRGLAQIISKQADATGEVRQKSCEIIDETDRVTAQLNEFINFSRPLQVWPTAVRLSGAVNEVVRALNYDLEEKHISLEIAAEPITIEADEQLLRQALFNLVMNAIQAVGANGQIQIRARKSNGSEAVLEIADDGPGVLPEHRAEIFKPYFTTHQEGTGLGLAMVQQIILAHSWEIECVPNLTKGALFRITHLALAAKQLEHVA